MVVVDDTVFEVQDDGNQFSLTRQEVLDGLAGRRFSLDASVRTNQSEPWSPLMQRSEFVDLSPMIQFDHEKGPREVGGGYLRGSDVRRVMDMVREYRQGPQFRKLGFFFPAVIPGSITVLQALHMFRLHSRLYIFFSCESVATPGGEIRMTLGVVNLDREAGTCTDILLEGATLTERSRGAMRFDLPPRYFDIRDVVLVAPDKPGKGRIKIKSESREMTFGRNVALTGARVALDVALGGMAGGVLDGVLGGALGKPVVLSVHLEVMDPKREKRASDRQTQIFATLTRNLDERGVKGMRSKYGDVIPRENVWTGFTRFASLARVDNMAGKHGTDPVALGNKMFSVFVGSEYGIKDLQTSYV